MTEKLRVPGLSDDESRILDHLLEELRQRTERNTLRASYYDGRRAIRQLGDVIPPQYFKLAWALGWSAKAVDLLARRCNFDRMVWPGGDIDSLGVGQLMEDNSLSTELNGAVLASLQHGPAFLINVEGEPGEPASQIHVRDALTATGDWNPRRRRLDSLLSITERGEAEDEILGFVLYLDGVVITANRDSVRHGWSVDHSGHSWGVPAEVFPYRPLPRKPFGQSRISRPIMALHDSGLRTVIRLEGHMDVYSYPQLWLLGADAKLFAGRPSWQIMLGRAMALPDNEDAENPRAEVKQFAAQSPEPHLAQLNALAKMFAREASLPDTAVAITDMANPTSADAYDASQHELIAEAEGATDDWTPPLRRTVQRALAIQNGLDAVPEEWRSMDALWRSPRFLSRAQQADAGQKQLAAVPWLAESEVGLELLGLTPQQITRALADRRRQGGSAALRRISERVDRQQPLELPAGAVSDDDAVA